MKRLLSILLISVLLIIPSIVKAEDMLSFGGSTPTSKELYVGSIVPDYDTTQDIAIKAATGEYDFAALLSNINQSLKYKVNIVNNTTNDYIVDSVSLRDSSKNFLKFSYSGIEKHNLIKAGTSKEVYLQIDTVDYVEKGVSEDYKLDINYSVNGSILNPKTGVYSYLVASLIVMALFVIGMKGVKNNSKFKAVCLILIPVIFISLSSSITAKDENVLTINGNISFKDLVNLLHLSIDPNEGRYNNSSEVFKANVEKDTVIDLSGVERDNYFFNYWIYNDLSSVVKTDSYKVEQDSDFVADWLYDSCSKVETVSDPNPGEFRGEGTSSSPYLIESVEDLVHLSVINNGNDPTPGTYYKLENNLDMKCTKSYVNSETEAFGDYNGDGVTNNLFLELTEGAGWSPIYFMSYLDGNNKTIYNLYMNESERYSNGFFSYLKIASDDEQVLVHDLSLLNIDFTVGNTAGGLASYLEAAYGYSGRAVIDNVVTHGNITCGSYCAGFIASIRDEFDISNIKGYVNVKGNSTSYSAGISSYAYGIYGDKSNVTNIYNYGTINSSDGQKGGCFGQIEHVNLDHVYNYGNVYDNNFGGYVAGIAAQLNYGKSQYLYNYGNITGSKSYIGGISGNFKYGEAHDVYNFGTVKVINNEQGGYGQVGGISGAIQENAHLYNAVNNGDVISNSGTISGGIVGYCYAYLNNVANNGDVIVTSDNAQNYNYPYVGGIVGEATNSTMFDLHDAYNTGNVSFTNDLNKTSSYIGGIMGYKSSENVNNVYSVGDITVNSDVEVYSGMVTGVTDRNLKNVYVKGNYYGKTSTSLFASYFSGYDLDNIYVDINTDIDKLYTARQVTNESNYSNLTNMYYDIHNYSGEKVLTGASAFDSSKINSNWFKDTLKLGNAWKYENGKYPKLYAVDASGNVLDRLVDHQIDLKL